jgi:hypothetical protein
MSRLAGVHTLQVNGVTINVVGNWTYNLGVAQREGLTGPDGVHGYKETNVIPFIEGEIRDRAELDIAALASTTGATVTLALANGKIIVLREAWAAGEWTGNTEDANLPARFEGKSAQEIA